MTAFAPPEFVFPGINFNPNFYDNPPLTPGGGAVIPNPLPVAQLNTNTIQALNNATPVNLYTTFADILTLGGALVTNFVIESGAALSILGTSILTIGSSALNNLYLNAYSVNFYSVETYFNNVLNTCRICLFPNDTYPSIQFNSSTSGGFQDVSIEANPKVTTATTDYEGTLRLRAAELITPQSISAGTPSSQVNLYTNQTAQISLGASAITLKIPNTILAATPSSVMNLFIDQTNSISLGNSGITLRSPNTVVGQLASAPQNLFTTTTGAINLGGASTLRLSTPNDVVSAAIATAVNLFNTQTAAINFGTLSSALALPLNIITASVASALNLFNTQTAAINFGTLSSALALPLNIITASVASTLNLFNTQTGQINLGATSSTLVVPNTVRSTAGTAQTLFTNQTQNVTLGGSSVPTLGLTGLTISNLANSISSTGITVANRMLTTFTAGNIVTKFFSNNTLPTVESVTVEHNFGGTAANQGTFIVRSDNTYLWASTNVTLGLAGCLVDSGVIRPTLTTYDATDGTNITGSIGEVRNQAVTPTTTLTFSGTGATREASIICGNLTLPFGVYIVSANIILRSLSTSSNLCSIEMRLTPNICNNAFLNNFSTGTVNVANYEIPINGCGIFTSVSGANVATFSISVRASTGSWAIISNIGKTWFKAVRIA
jgi:hypothetical protein